MNEEKKPESAMVEFKMGDRVLWNGDAVTDVISGVLTKSPSAGYARAVRDDGRKGGGPDGEWVICVSARNLRLESAPAAAEWEPRENEWVEGVGVSSGMRRIGRFVRHEKDYSLTHDGIGRAVTRSVTRSSLRPASAPAQAGSMDAAHRETAAVTPSGEALRGSTQPVEPGRPDPYGGAPCFVCGHRAPPFAGGRCGDCSAMNASGRMRDGSADKTLDQRIKQAKQQLDSGLTGRRYPYAESSLIWSSPSSESDQ